MRGCGREGVARRGAESDSESEGVCLAAPLAVVCVGGVECGACMGSANAVVICERRDDVLPCVGAFGTILKTVLFGMMCVSEVASDSEYRQITESSNNGRRGGTEVKTPSVLPFASLRVLFLPLPF